MSKLEETFNLPSAIDNLEKSAKDIMDAYEDESELDKKVNAQLDEFLDKTENFLNLQDFEKDMDALSDKLMQDYEDTSALAKDLEPRHIGEVLSAAASMAKIALDAKKSVMDAKLKTIDLKIKEMRVTGGKKEDDTPIEGTQINRDELLELAKQARKN